MDLPQNLVLLGVTGIARVHPCWAVFIVTLLSLCLCQIVYGSKCAALKTMSNGFGSKTGWLREEFLCWLVVATVVSTSQLLWWHQ
ncbi:hypothetical protein Hanom_Chr05g00467841 [Helianthus anomalus]